MKKIGLGILVAITILVISGVATARMLIPAEDRAKEKAGEYLPLTPPALEKILFIHRKKDFGKPPWAGGRTSVFLLTIVFKLISLNKSEIGCDINLIKKLTFK